MVHMMFLHHWTQTKAARELSINKKTKIFTETRRGDKRRKRPRNYATLRMCTVPHVRS